MALLARLLEIERATSGARDQFICYVLDPAVTSNVAWVNGLQILVKRIPGSEISSSQLYLRGGVRNWGADNAGVEELAINVATSGGTEKLDKDAPTLAESERNRRQRELVEQNRDFDRKRREFQEDLTQRKNEELASVVERANKVMKQIFDSEKYDLIIQEAVFAGPKIDITDKVIKALNAQTGAK